MKVILFSNRFLSKVIVLFHFCVAPLLIQVGNEFCSCLKKFLAIKNHSYGNSPIEVFCKKVVLQNFAKFTGKNLCWSLFLIKLTMAQVFSYEFCEILKNTFFYRTPPAAASVFTKSHFNKSQVVPDKAFWENVRFS